MEQLISTFHIDIPLVAAQVLNFAVVFLVLYFFAIKPLLKVMSERSKTIEDGLKNAGLSEEKIIEAQKESESIILSAKKDASGIISDAHDTAKKEGQAVLAAAQKEKEGVVLRGKEEIEQHKKEAERAFREESAEVVVESMKKMFTGYVASGRGENLIKDIVGK